MAFTNRLRPEFIIIGGVKFASSSFYRYLISHPNVLPCAVKETFFFSNKRLLSAVIRLPKYLKLFPERSSDEDAKLQWFKFDDNRRVIEYQHFKPRNKETLYITGEVTAV